MAGSSPIVFDPSGGTLSRDTVLIVDYSPFIVYRSSDRLCIEIVTVYIADTYQRFERGTQIDGQQATHLRCRLVIASLGSTLREIYSVICEITLDLCGTGVGRRAKVCADGHSLRSATG